jgi:hypothetical protein
VPRHGRGRDSFGETAAIEASIAAVSPKPRSWPAGELTGQARLVFQDAVPLPDGRSMFLSDHYGVEADLWLR